MTMIDPGSSEKERVTGVFDRAAATYDRVGPRFFSHFGQRLVECAGIARGNDVLDVAAGRGAVLFPAAERVGPGGRVVGVDLSEHMVRETSAEIARAGWRHVEMRRMDAEQLDFPDAAFDRVLSGFSLWFFPHPDAALREFIRVLKPGGVLGLSTWAEGDPAQVFARKLLRTFLPPGVSAGTAAKPDAVRFNTPAQIETALQQTGFVNIRVTVEENDFVYRSGDDWWASLWSMGTRASLEKMSPEVLEQAKLSGLQQVQAFRQADGIHIARRALIALGTKRVA
jgi:ubiquinone/menaquinone biosynthesis C-methylase UbiE